MNAKSLKTLEFSKITERLAARAASPMGKQMAAALTPMTDLGDIQRAQGQTAGAAAMIVRKGSLPMGGASDIRGALARAAAGGMLNADELMRVGEFCYVCRKIITYGAGSADELATYFSAVVAQDSLEGEISRCILPGGEVADNASPKLAGIRRSVKSAHDKIRDSLQSMIHSASYKNMLQDAIVTLRGDRFCLPVKAEFKRDFPGMIHDQSGSGSTVFMEPTAVVELNNKIKDLHFEEKREEERILFKLSGQVAGASDQLEVNLQMITHLDFAFAKGEMALQMDASAPVFNDRGYVNIKRGRHPLLNQDTVVPTNIHLGGEFSMLLITGPNTGGKTVALKTIGLFTLMGQAGLHIPAFEGSELAVFGDVFADIGDEQSIEQSLSTFSSHMTNIVSILGEVAHDSLVLMDELGAGTDPTEGAALAIALLQFLHARAVRTVITTHYSELKLYALSTEGVENAGCEFDLETLRPTYRLLIGIPGKSNAFAIAKRLGLSDEIIGDARQVLSQKDVRFEDMITDIEASKKAVIIEQDRAEALRREAQKLQAAVTTQEEKLASQKEKILTKARAEAAELVQAARRDAEKLVREMRKELTSAKGVDDARQKMREGFQELAEKVEPVTQKPERKPPEKLQRGDRVHVHSMGQEGVVSAPPDGAGEVLISAGIMKLKVHISDLSLIEEDTPTLKNAMKKHSGGGEIKSATIRPEVDLRGMLPEEARSVAEKYLDDAFLASLSTVTIIHGKGTGTLRNTIQQICKKHPHVRESRPGRYGEGEMGVTVVTLR
jgi:DNA mismatch repair protein MutS2